MSTIDRPLHPLPQMTSSEIDGYRRNLQNALSADAGAENSATREVLRKRLADVLEEQADRRRIATTGSYGYPAV